MKQIGLFKATGFPQSSQCWGIHRAVEVNYKDSGLMGVADGWLPRSRPEGSDKGNFWKFQQYSVGVRCLFTYLFF